MRDGDNVLKKMILVSKYMILISDKKNINFIIDNIYYTQKTKSIVLKIVYYHYVNLVQLIYIFRGPEFKF
jgi:hypothetical protein